MDSQYQRKRDPFPSMTLTPDALSHATLAVWSSVLVAGWLGGTGVRAQQTIVTPEATAPAPVQPLTLKLEPANHPDNATSTPVTTAPAAAEPKPPTPVAEAPAAPRSVAVAPPGSVPEFAVAVSGPVVFAEQSASASAAGRTLAGPVAGVRSAPPVETLTYGAGAGAQPAPDYPRDARRKGREGDVTVRFTVNADGTVGATQVASACLWPTLNDAAENTIRTRWRFAPGRERRYEITIRFRLSR